MAFGGQEKPFFRISFGSYFNVSKLSSMCHYYSKGFCTFLFIYIYYLYSYYFTGTFWSLKHISSYSFGLRDLKFTTQLANCLRLLKKEIFFRSNPQSRLLAQKGVIIEGLEALLLPLEHCLQNRSC